MVTMSDDALVSAVSVRIEGVRGPNNKGWYQAHCPFPEHEDRTRSFGFTSRGYKCHGCERSGSLVRLAEEMGIAASGVDNRLSEEEAERRLRRRGLRYETLAHFGIRADLVKQAWIFSVGVAGAEKARNFDPDAGPKYWWVRGQPAEGADLYNSEACVVGDEIWLVEGEPDVWTAHQAGIPAVSFTGGVRVSGTPTERDHSAIEDIIASGVTIVNVCFDNDQAGQSAARSVVAALRARGVTARLRPLPADDVGPKGDLTDLYLHVGKDDAALRAAMAELPVSEISDRAESDAKPPARHEPDEWRPPIPLTDVRVPAFPIEVLPDWMGSMVEQVTQITQTPGDLGATFLLAVLSTIWGRRVKVEIDPFWRESINLYVLAVAESGTRKSAVYAHLLEPLIQWEILERERERPEIRRKLLEIQTLEGRLKRAKRAAAKAEARDERAAHLREAEEILAELDALGPAVPLRLLADSVTPEKLVSLLAEQNGRMAIIEPEGALFGMLSGRYSRFPDLTAFLKGHPGEDIRTDRISRGSELVRSPALSLGFAVQPGVLASLASNPELRGTGLLARFLYALPSPHVGRRSNERHDASRATVTSYGANVTRLLDAAVALDEGGPKVVRLSSGAHSAFREWRDYIEPELAEFGCLGDIPDWGSKLAGATARIAGLLHLSRAPEQADPWQDPIAEETMTAAIAMGRYYIPHARAAHTLMGQDEGIAIAQHVWRWIVEQDEDVLTGRDIFEGTKGRLKKMKNLRPVLALLVEHECLREIPGRKREGPGRPPSPKYAVNPLALERGP